MILEIILIVFFIIDIVLSIVYAISKNRYISVLEKQNKVLWEHTQILHKYWKLVFGTEDKQEKADEDNQDSNENV